MAESLVYSEVNIALSKIKLSHTVPVTCDCIWSFYVCSRYHTEDDPAPFAHLKAGFIRQVVACTVYIECIIVD